MKSVNVGLLYFNEEFGEILNKRLNEVPEFLDKHIEYLKDQVRLMEYEKHLVELLIQAYDKEIDRLYSKLEDQEHRYEQYVKELEQKIVLLTNDINVIF